MTDDRLDIVHPKVIEGFVPVPPTEEVAVFGVDTHCVATAFRECVVIGVVPVVLENESDVEGFRNGRGWIGRVSRGVVPGARGVTMRIV